MFCFRSSDPEKDFMRWDEDCEKWLEKYPKCCHCHEHIQPGDLYYEVDGDLYCAECIDTIAKRMEEIA